MTAAVATVPRRAAALTRLSELMGLAPLPASGSGSKAAIELLRATLRIRVQQSFKVLPLLPGTLVLLAVDLWEVLDPITPLLIWMSAMLGLTAVRAGLCKYVARRLDTASPAQLHRFEVLVFCSGLTNSLCVGSAFWIVAGPERATSDISLASCMYAVGSMINSSVQTRPFVWFIGANMGQGILFSLGVFSSEFDPFRCGMSVTVLVLLIGFGMANGESFARSFRMREENAQLVQQLNREKQTVEHALARAKEAVASQSRFLAAASHDLRQPLHALNLYLGPLQKYVTDEAAVHMLQRIIECSDVLGEQLNGMLDISQLDAGGVEVEARDFSLDRMLKRIVEGVRFDAEQRGLSLTLQAGNARAYSDPVLLERVVRNLVDNAIRYTERGGVEVTATREGPRIRVAVADTGPGIAEADCARIFEDFVQLHNPNRLRSRGVGLGLANVRRLDQLMDLRLQLHSRVGEGSTFTFWVSEGTSEAEGEPKQSPPAKAAPALAVGLTIWAVEDDPSAAAALEMHLKSLGCTTLLATCRSDLEQAALERDGWPDLALVDDMLGGSQSGLQIAQWLQSSMPAHPNPRERILVLTGNSDPERLDEIRRSGFRLLQKPLRPGELETVVARLARP
jgi:two-component system, sensor histidine kinase